ncbi:MAG: phosphoenolpyruvate carboxylase, partial [Cyanobacteria bacterium P01_D01_bin.73]
MSSTTQLLDRGISRSSASDLFLHHRLKVVEDQWRNVLKQECGQELVDLLDKMRDLCTPEGQASDFPTAEVLPLVEDLDLNEAIQATRAFALYFQLINIVEQHYEQRVQREKIAAPPQAQDVIQDAISPPSITSNGTVNSAINNGAFNNGTVNATGGKDVKGSVNDSGRGVDGAGTSGQGSGAIEATLLEKTVPPSSEGLVGTFSWLFPFLKRVNVPPRQIQRLIDQLDVQLVFTAHPTEIVRHTIRGKQRRIVRILQELDRTEEGGGA